MSEFNENIKKLYQSYPESEFQYQTLEIYHPTMTAPIRLYKTQVPIDKNFKLEATAPRDAGSSVIFTASDFNIAESNQGISGDNSISSVSFGPQSLVYVNEILDGMELDAISFLDPMEFIYRIYHNADTGIGPSITPTITYGISIQMSVSSGTSIKLSSTNNRRYKTGDIYSITDFPGLISNA